MKNGGDVTDCKNLQSVQTQNNAGAVNDTTLYDLEVFNKLAMDLRTPAARNNVNFLEKWGEVTMAKNFVIVKMQNSAGTVKDTLLRLSRQYTPNL